MLVAIRKYCSDLLWRSHPPKNMGRARANVTRRTCFSGIFIVNLQVPGEPCKTGHPGEAPNSTPKHSPSAKSPAATRQRNNAAAEALAKAQFFVLALRPDQSRAVKDRTRIGL